MRTRWRCILFSDLGLYRWADNTFLSASFVFSSVGHYFLRDPTTVFSISACLTKWCPQGGWQSDTAVLIRGIMVPTIGCRKVRQDQVLFFHTNGNPFSVLCYQGHTWPSLWKELHCQCLAVKPMRVCVPIVHVRRRSFCHLPCQGEDHLKRVNKKLKPSPA